MKRNYPPDVIDMALVATLRMLNRGKAVVWQGARMYLTNQGACVNGEVVGDAVDATLLWFERYSQANPRKSNWGEDQNTIALLKQQFA